MAIWGQGWSYYLPRGFKIIHTTEKEIKIDIQWDRNHERSKYLLYLGQNTSSQVSGDMDWSITQSACEIFALVLAATSLANKARHNDQGDHFLTVYTLITLALEGASN